MRMSDARKQRLYAAMSGAVMDLRVRISRADTSGAPLDPRAIDDALFRLEQKLWQNVQHALEIGDER